MITKREKKFYDVLASDPIFQDTEQSQLLGCSDVHVPGRGEFSPDEEGGLRCFFLLIFTIKSVLFCYIIIPIVTALTVLMVILMYLLISGKFEEVCKELFMI